MNLKEEYDKVYKTALTELREKQKQIKTILEEMTQIAEKRGIAFETYDPGGARNWYLPKSFKEKWGDVKLLEWLVDDEWELKCMNLDRNGWQKSYC